MISAGGVDAGEIVLWVGTLGRSLGHVTTAGRRQHHPGPYSSPRESIQTTIIRKRRRRSSGTAIGSIAPSTTSLDHSYLRGFWRPLLLFLLLRVASVRTGVAHSTLPSIASRDGWRPSFYSSSLPGPQDITTSITTTTMMRRMSIRRTPLTLGGWTPWKISPQGWSGSSSSSSPLLSSPGPLPLITTTTWSGRRALAAYLPSRRTFSSSSSLFSSLRTETWIPRRPHPGPSLGGHHGPFARRLRRPAHSGANQGGSGQDLDNEEEEEEEDAHLASFEPTRRKPAAASRSQWPDDPEDTTDVGGGGYTRPVVQWYPGHIAKAERQLQETFLRAIDVVLEVRDARIAQATRHPQVPRWCGQKPRLVVMTHVDQVPVESQRAWQRALQQQQQPLAHSHHQDDAMSPSVEQVLFVNAKEGSGIFALKRAIFKAGAFVQERRQRRGLKERALRVGIIGFPNVGKSALINRLLGRKRAKTANTPGVTRTLQWIRVRSDDAGSDGESKPGSEFELLDSPGIIPASLTDQSDAALLAACNCIGDAAYDNQVIAAYLCDWLLSLYRLGYGPQAAPEWQRKCIERYGLDPLENTMHRDLAEGPIWEPRTGEDLVYEVADRTCQGNPEDAARKILQDFRTGRMGPICLQVAPTPETTVNNGSGKTPISMAAQDETKQRYRQEIQDTRKERGRRALEMAHERGLELPPQIMEKHAQVSAQEVEAEDEPDEEGADGTDPAAISLKGKKGSSTPASQIGKGMFEGW